MTEYTFNSLVEEIAKNKVRLSEHRFQKREKNEIPREVYLNACETIAEYYKPLNFKYSKSQHKMTLKKGEFLFTISFQSSMYNIADENVKIIVHANISSVRLKKWEKESQYEMFNRNPNGYIGGAQIGNLQENSTWLEWNVAIPETRNMVIKDIIDNINHFALPFFDKFSDIESIKEIFVKEGEHYSINRESFLLYFFTKKDLETSLIRFLSKRDMWSKYEDSLKKISNGKKVGGTYWETIALTKNQLDLELEKPMGN
jgi:hypothetical protein